MDVTRLLDQAGDAFALTADHHSDGDGQVDIPEARFPPRRGADDPVAGFLEVFEGLREVGHLDDWQMISRARRRFDDGFGQADGAMFADDDTMCACSFSTPDERTEVVGVDDSVADEQESGTFLGRFPHDLVEGAKGDGLHICQHALVCVDGRELIDPLARNATHGDPKTRGRGLDLVDAAPDSFRHENLFDPLSRRKSFHDGMAAGDHNPIAAGSGLPASSAAPFTTPTPTHVEPTPLRPSPPACLRGQVRAAPGSADPVL